MINLVEEVFQVFPLSLGISTPRIGCGRYFPVIIDSMICDLFRSNSVNCSALVWISFSVVPSGKNNMAASAVSK